MKETPHQEKIIKDAKCIEKCMGLKENIMDMTGTFYLTERLFFFMLDGSPTGGKEEVKNKFTKCATSKSYPKELCARAKAFLDCVEEF